MKLIEFINKYLNQHDFCPDYLATGKNDYEVIVKYQELDANQNNVNFEESILLTSELCTRNLRVWKNISIMQTWESDSDFNMFKVFTFKRVWGR